MRSGDFILPLQILNRLRDCFIFKFVLLRHIIVGNTNVFFRERLDFNPFIFTFVHFTVVVFIWYYFTSYSIILPMYISARVFDTLKVYFRCFIYITTKILHTGFGIIELWPYFPYPPVFPIIGILLPLFVTNVR